MLRRSQSSLIELLIIALSVSVALTLSLSIKVKGLELIRSDLIESEEVLINYLKYELYNESNLLIINQQQSNQSFFKPDSDFFNKTIELIEYLNNNNSFIIFSNSTNPWTIYNTQPTVCLQEARLSSVEFNHMIITYGSWKGEAPEKC